MGALRLILGDQLSHHISSLQGADKAQDVVLMVEVAEEATYVPHHAQKIILLFAAMRHFAAALRARGFRVDYVTLDDPENTGSFTGELARALHRHPCQEIVVTEAGEWRVQQMFAGWPHQFERPVTVRDDTRFFCSRAEFAAFAASRRQLRMEFFYRAMRQKTGLLMDGGAPCGGRWNFDADNRAPPDKHLRPPTPPQPPPDAITEDVRRMVPAHFPHTFGEAEDFFWAVTAEAAEERAAWFLTHALPHFGTHQDAMLADSPFMYHSLLSPYLNCGLLDARTLCARAEAEYRAGRAPLNSVEGFIRQILGWREYVRGIYWLKMPGYAQENRLDARRPLPDFYWTAQTPMRCVALAVQQTRRYGYAHHIQRLMVLGNFALLAGLDVAAVCRWYLSVFVDAYEWVELPNTLGMALHADGGFLGSKPYAASGKYIQRMSDSCTGCAYDPKESVGPRACPFNALYWHFLDRHKERFARNPRMAQMVAVWRKMAPQKRADLLAQAQRFLDGLT